MAAVVAMSFAANAQSNSFGLRFGGGSGYGAELSYQQGLGGNRLEVDLGLSRNNDNYFHLTGMYQWVMNISGGLNWYLGPGAQIGYCTNHGLGLGIGGQIGIEYKFGNIPLQISFDFRPLWNVMIPEYCGNLSSFGYDGAFSIRYCF